jgi:hypothetical protein
MLTLLFYNKRGNPYIINLTVSNNPIFLYLCIGAASKGRINKLKN